MNLKEGSIYKCRYKTIESISSMKRDNATFKELNQKWFSMELAHKNGGNYMWCLGYIS